MKKVLYILIAKRQTLILFENNSVKYFEEGGIEDLDKYLKDKIRMESIKVKKEKFVEYYGEKYIVKLVDIKGLEEVIDKSSIKPVDEIERRDLTYKDNILLDSFFIYGFTSKKFKNSFISDNEKKIALRNFYISIVVAVLTAVFSIAGGEFNYIGVSYPIIIFFISLLVIYSIGRVKKINYIGVYFVALSMILSITYAVYTNIYLRVGNFIIIPLMLAVGLHLLSYYEEKFTFNNCIYNIFPNSVVKIFNSKPFFLLDRVLFNNNTRKSRDAKSIAVQRGVLISIPLIVVLILLLSSADQFFGDILKGIVTEFRGVFNNTTIDKMCIKILIGVIMFIIIYCFLSRLRFKTIDKINNIKTYFDMNTVNTVLIMVNILYGFFTSVQIRTLFIRYRGILSAEKYSEYAREGFFQLITVVVINIFIILISKNRVKYNKTTKILNTIMTALSMGMTMSSMYKMSLYINKYGLTRLRFATSIFMIFTLVSLIFILISLWKSVNLFKYTILAGSVFYLLMNFANMDKCIAGYNLNKIEGEVDKEYITNLSLDCIETIKESYINGKIDKETYEKYIKSNEEEKKYRWFEYNYYNAKSKD